MSNNNFSDFQPKLMLDSRLAVTSDVEYAVQLGAQSISQVQFNASSQSLSTHTYNISIPNETTIVSRYIYWQSTVTFKIAFPAPIPSTSVEFQYGIAEAFSSFPLNNLCNSVSITINNNTTTTNVQSILPALIRMLPPEINQRLNGSTPLYNDSYFNYDDALESNNNPLSSYGVTSNNYNEPRGSFKLNSVVTNLGPFDPNAATVISYLLIEATFTEPLLVSPFIFNQTPNDQGFYSINNMSISMAIDATAHRSYRMSRYKTVTGAPNLSRRAIRAYFPTISVHSFKNSNIQMEFLTPKAGALELSARNVVPYYEFNRQTVRLDNFTITNNRRTFVSNTVALNQIPDKLICFVSPKTYTNYDPDIYLVINNISITFANSSGILSNCNIRDLWRMSVKNGSNQSFSEFSGSANFFCPLQQAGTNNSMLPAVVPTCGSMLVLSFGDDIQLGSLDMAPGVLGTFSFSIKIDCSLQQTGTLPYSNVTDGVRVDRDDVVRGITDTNSEYVLNTFFLNSGIFVNNKGTSSIFTGLLSRQDVLKSLTQDVNMMHTTNRIVGGGFFDSLRGMVNRIAPIAKNVLKMVPHPTAQTASKILDIAGYGETGAGETGAGKSGGKKKISARLM